MRLTASPRPMTMWSSSSTPSSFAASASSFVMATSSELGDASPEGWLWATMTCGTAATTAARRTSAGRTTADQAFPW